MRYLSLLLVLLAPDVFGQFVQDASGKSTLKLNGNVLNIDITDARLSYWYQQTSIDQGRIANKLRVVQQELDSLQKINSPTPAQQGAIILAQENVDALDRKRQKMVDKSMRGNLLVLEFLQRTVRVLPTYSVLVFWLQKVDSILL